MYSTIVLFIKALGIFSGFLMLGTFLRAKVPVFQNLYLPASVIGGFIALILGPNVLNILPFSEDVMAIASSLPLVATAIPHPELTTLCRKCFVSSSE